MSTARGENGRARTQTGGVFVPGSVSESGWVTLIIIINC